MRLVVRHAVVQDGDDRRDATRQVLKAKTLMILADTEDSSSIEQQHHCKERGIACWSEGSETG